MVAFIVPLRRRNVNKDSVNVLSFQVVAGEIFFQGHEQQSGNGHGDDQIGQHVCSVIDQRVNVGIGEGAQALHLCGDQDAVQGDAAEIMDSETAQAAQVVREKEGGLEAQVAQGGTNFSGGQRQRLTIARALVRKPKILILDDSASALDYATDAALRQAIRGMENPPTTFIVSQRASSVRFADIILVLEDGEMVDSGTHEELLSRCAVYQEIYYSQFEKEAASHG